MKQSKMPADPNRRAKATVDAIDAILDRWPESDPLPPPGTRLTLSAI
jgi:hypothetical protein